MAPHRERWEEHMHDDDLRWDAHEDFIIEEDEWNNVREDA